MADALAHPTKETHFEVHVLKGDRWIIESTSREQAAALEDAKNLIRMSAIRGVKVFKETMDLESGRSAAISIFNEMKQERRQSPRTAVSRPRPPTRRAPAKAKAGPARRAGKPPQTQEQTSDISSYVIIGTILFMLIAGGITLYALLQPGDSVPLEIREKPPWVERPLQ